MNNYEDSYLGSADLAARDDLLRQLHLRAAGHRRRARQRRRDRREDGDRDRPRPTPSTRSPNATSSPTTPLILGGLEVGVTPLEMAHAYNTLAADSMRRSSGTMAASSGGPLRNHQGRKVWGRGLHRADHRVQRSRELVEDNTGASGEDEVVAKQVVDPAVAGTTRDVLSTVVESGTGENAATGEPTWGKTGTTDDNGDAWFCGATEEITACV